jgi:hypothetical protein
MRERTILVRHARLFFLLSTHKAVAEASAISKAGQQCDINVWPVAYIHDKNKTKSDFWSEIFSIDSTATC